MNKGTKRKADPYEDFDAEGESVCRARRRAGLRLLPWRPGGPARARAHGSLRLLSTYDEAYMAFYRLGGSVIACSVAEGLVAKVFRSPCVGS